MICRDIHLCSTDGDDVKKELRIEVAKIDVPSQSKQLPPEMPRVEEDETLPDLEGFSCVSSLFY